MKLFCRSIFKIFLILTILFGCATTGGEQELDYIYAIPEQIDDSWDVSSLADEGLNTALIEELIRTCLDGKLFPKTDSVLIARNGKLVLEEYFHRQTREKLHMIQSVTKSVTSMLVGIAIERGKIEGVEQLVYPIFPEYKGRKWIDEEYDITLKDVLTMTGGLDWDESSLPYIDPKNDNVAMNLSGDWIGYTLDKGRAFKPGEKFVYCSGLSILLGGMIKNSTGMYADEYAEKHLFGPLGITDYMWTKSPQGTRHTGGGLSLRPMDFLKLGQVMLDGGTWKGKRILPEKWTKDSLREHVSIHEKIQYGYQWWLYTFKTPNGPVKTAMGRGYGGQYIMIAPTLNLVAVTTAHNFKGAGISWEKIFSYYILPAAQ
jgi:CubicO group peptidase (beta-lactamase class C family)